MRTVDIIIKKRDNQELTNEEIKFIVDGYVDGSIPDYQISSLLMAIFFNKLNKREMTQLTKCMLESGEQVDLSNVKGVKVDKHSTGGVGDKTSLVVGPLAAALSIKMAKMSGRGLGHTGGTLDKLESIPGFKIELSSQGFIDQVNNLGVAIIGQSENITPADKKLYSLRDVTGTVNSIGLIASSIMSKKLASGADTIVLDVKVGNGAFMKTIEEAEELARNMVDIGNMSGKLTVATLTDMSQPLGNAIGNALEVIEAIETLKGNGPKDFEKLCVEFVKEILEVTNVANSVEEAEELVMNAINDKSGLEVLRQMIIAQGGNGNVIDDYTLMASSKEIIEVRHNGISGYVKEIDALMVGEAAMYLGAGRQTKEESIDYGVGIVLNKKVGDYVEENDILGYIHTNGKSTKQAIKMLIDSYTLQAEKVEKAPIILKVIR